MISPFHPDGLSWLLSIKEPITQEGNAFFDAEWAKESISELLERELVKKTDAGYYGSFTRWLTYANDGRDKDLILRDKEKWLTVFESPLVRRVFFDPIVIMHLYKDNLMNIADDGYNYPYIVALLLALECRDSELSKHLDNATFLEAMRQGAFPPTLSIFWFQFMHLRFKVALQNSDSEWQPIREIISSTIYAEKYNKWALRLLESVLNKMQYFTAAGLKRRLARFSDQIFGKPIKKDWLR